MKKLFLCVSLVLTGLMTSCVEKYQEEGIDPDSKPAWLGGSIYEELKNANQNMLTGTFTNYLRLVDDLKESETLQRTGSVTVFPANDQAFGRFFENNPWGVRSYEELTETQKKLLLKSSMLDNALLVGMLSNVSSGTEDVAKGMALKHETSVKVIDTIQHIYGPAGMPANNPYWKRYYNKGIDIVSDGTRPYMVHFTREYMLNNNMTTSGANSDFEILTGSPYTEGTGYVFNRKIIKSDVTCMNGYIQQVDDVIVPPGNMAEAIRNDASLHFYSRILDYMAVPMYNSSVTKDYNDYVVAIGRPDLQKDSIYEWRYLSQNSQGSSLLTPPYESVPKGGTEVLPFDPGWNGYYPKVAGSTLDYSIADMGVMFVPTDKAMMDYFLPGGNGAFMIDLYGAQGLANDSANLKYHLDSFYVKRPRILTSFMRNMMKSQFKSTVPSMFPLLTNDTQENLGMNIDVLNVKADGKKNIKIANNGVIYVIDQLLVPDEYNSVLAPSSTFNDMLVFDKVVNNHDKTWGVFDFNYYLLAMKSKYALFVPDDAAFDTYYLDPITLPRAQKQVLHFYVDSTSTLRCDRYNYNMTTKAITGNPVSQTIASVSTQLNDILNYHTVVLGANETPGSKHFYITKHNGAIRLDNANVGGKVYGPSQIDNGLEPSTITAVYPEQNGWTYRINRVIEPPHNSVYKTLQSNEKTFKDFFELAAGFEAARPYMRWAGISDTLKAGMTNTEMDRYIVFTNKYSSDSKQPDCVDNNVKMFNTYHYTLYAPNTDAMKIAKQKGLPDWNMVRDLYLKYYDESTDKPLDDPIGTDSVADKALALKYIKAIYKFVRYHFQSRSDFADITMDSPGKRQTLLSNDLGMAEEVDVNASGNRLTVTDKSGLQHVIDANNTSMLSNVMTRDYWFNMNSSGSQTTGIKTSSFCTIHEIAEPFYLETSRRYDGTWNNASAKRRYANKK